MEATEKVLVVVVVVEVEVEVVAVAAAVVSDSVGMVYRMAEASGRRSSTFLASTLNKKHRLDDVICTSSRACPSDGTHSAPYFLPELASAMAFTRSAVSFFNLR